MPDEFRVPDEMATVLVYTGFARRLPDGSIELTEKGARWTLDWLRREAPGDS